MAVVFDSGVWISALKYGGVPFQALRSAFALDQIACCAEIRAEVERVMGAKFGWYREDTVIAMERFVDGRSNTRISGVVKGVCRDPNDDMVLECALVAGATHIVSGDSDLLILTSFSGISIVSARKYLDTFGQVPTSI
jgi:putative PIN family toxin of toxin-antitoxin system